MALEMQAALGNGLQFRDAYVQVNTFRIKRARELVLDEDGNRMLVDDADRKKGFKTRPCWQANAVIHVFKNKSVRDQGLKAVEKRTETFDVDITKPIMEQLYAAMKASGRYDGAKDA